MFVYNHKQSEWREQAAMKTPRAMFGAVVHNGKIIVVGGVNEEGLTASCEAYDFATNKYEYVCNFPFKWEHSLVTLLGTLFSRLLMHLSNELIAWQQLSVSRRPGQGSLLKFKLSIGMEKKGHLREQGMV